MPDKPFKHGSLFSGIGGFDLAAQWMGWENVFHCEWNTFGQKVLNYYWPKAKSYNDITKTDFTIHRGTIDILTGGFPCQPFSVAGKQLGTEDDRYLWPEMLRAIREIKPRFILGENVSGIVNWNDGLVFERVHTDLENEGYKVIPLLLPACSSGAPHIRNRVWFVAYSEGEGAGVLHNALEKEGSQCSNELSRVKSRISDWTSWPTQPPILNGNDGIPTRLDGITISRWRNESNRAAGNAIVPQVALQIFKAIEQFNNLTHAR